jgi:5S rRNA maturation endonuclease (ribonuclease M5)
MYTRQRVRKRSDRQPIELLKAQVDLRTVAEDVLGPAARQHGRYLQFHAPDRSDSDPSLTVWPESFFDFGNPEHNGDVFDFLAQYAGLGFRDALAYLEGNSPIISRPASATRPTPDAQENKNDPRWREEIQLLLSEFQATLWHTQQGQRVRQYLEEQGYSRQHMQQQGLGFNPTWRQMNWRKPDGSPAWIAPGIIYPWVQDGEIAGLKIRCATRNGKKRGRLSTLAGLSPQEQKYMQVAGGTISRSWYGTLHEGRPLIVCEGEKDRDNLAQRLGEAASVITLGSASGRVPRRLRSTISEADVPWLAIVLDNDKAGQRNSQRLAEKFRRIAGLTVITGQVPQPHKDLTDWILENADVNQWFEELGERAAVEPTPAVDDASTFIDNNSASDLRVNEKEYFPNNGVLPNPLREVLLSVNSLGSQGRRYCQDHSSSALVLELIQDTQLLPLPKLGPSRVGILSIQRILEAANSQGRSCTEKTIRKGIEQLVGLGFLELIPKSTPLYDRIKESEKIQGGKNGNNSKRGRPVDYYGLVPLEQALATMVERLSIRVREGMFGSLAPDNAEPEWFEFCSNVDGQRLAEEVNRLSEPLRQAQQQKIQEIEREYQQVMADLRDKLSLDTLKRAKSIPIPRELDFANGREYRDAYYKALVINAGSDGRQITRARAAEQIGVTVKTLSRIRRRTGVVTEAQFKEIELFSARDVLAQADEAAPWAAGRAFGRYLASSDGRRLRLDPRHGRHYDRWVAEQMAEGHIVKIQIQVASKEREGDPAEVEKRREEYRAWLHAKRQQEQCSQRPYCPNPQKNPLKGVSVPNPAPSAVCPENFSFGYVRDQMWLRLDVLLPAAVHDEEVLALVNAVGLGGFIAHADVSRAATQEELLLALGLDGLERRFMAESDSIIEPVEGHYADLHGADSASVSNMAY